MWIKTLVIDKYFVTIDKINEILNKYPDLENLILLDITVDKSLTELKNINLPITLKALIIKKIHIDGTLKVVWSRIKNNLEQFFKLPFCAELLTLDAYYINDKNQEFKFRYINDFHQFHFESAWTDGKDVIPITINQDNIHKHYYFYI